MRAAVLVTVLLVALAVDASVTSRNILNNPDRIIGGSVTTIENYPFAVGILLNSWWGSALSCGGTIINNRSVLTAAHCMEGAPSYYSSRVGSSWASSGGTVHDSAQFIIHPNYSRSTLDNDIGIIRIVGIFTYSNSVRAAGIAGANYNLPDNSAVTAIGWGLTQVGGSSSEQLRHVKIWTVNQAVCRQRYATISNTVTDNMLCSGWLDVGGRDQCQGDSGGPLIHNNVIVGVCSWGQSCALPYFPGVNTRVSRYTSWITLNAENNTSYSDLNVSVQFIEKSIKYL